MRKDLFMALICLAFTVSCSDDDDNKVIDPIPPGPDTTVVEKIDIAKYIVGEWVKETHDANVHSWETINFTSTILATINGSREEYTDGSLSNQTVIENSTMSCTIDGDKMTLKSSGGIDRTLTVSSINEVAFEATEGGVKVKYSRILGNTVEVGEEAQTPDYKVLLPEGVTISSYKSGNERVVNVNSKGELTSVASGSAYIYIETDKGTAAIRVEVKRLFEADYAALFGKTKADVEATLGKTYTEEEGKLIYSTQTEATFGNYYQRNAGNWSKIEATLDSEDKVSELTLTAREDVWFTTEQMTKALTEQYNAYDKASNETEKVFLNAASLKDATLRIIWNQEKRTLTFAPNSTDVIIGQETYMPDYEGLFGVTAIKSFRTENEYIVTVDAETGMLTGIDSGSTNIVVVTENETFVLPVQVHIFLVKDYEALLGKGRIDIQNLYGVAPSTDYDDENYDQMLYVDYISFPIKQRQTGNWTYIKFKMDNSWIGPVREILLIARDEVWFTDAQMVEFLKGKYTYDETRSADGISFFVNNKQEDLVTASIIWNANNHTLKISQFSYF